MASRPARTSATWRAIGPSVSISCAAMPGSCGGISVAHGTTPVVGLMEVMPQHVAGLRSDPPMSLPNPSGDMPLASAEPSPPLEPPAVRPGCHGLCVTPCSDDSVVMRSPRSGRLVRPIGMAPAARARCTSGASEVETASARKATACVVGVPARSMFSFTVTGTPCSAPNESPAATALSAASAAASEASSQRRTTAFNHGLTSSMRARWAATTSRLDTSLRAIMPASSSAPLRHSSLLIVRCCHNRPRDHRGGNAGGRGCRALLVASVA